MTLTGSGGTITYNGVKQTTTFRVAAGDSIVCTANAIGMMVSAVARITLNGTEVARKSGDGKVDATYTYQPKANATIKMTENRSENFYKNATISITETL